MIRKQPTERSTYELGLGLGNFADRRAWLGLGGALLEAVPRLTFRFDAKTVSQQNFRGVAEEQTGAVATVRYKLSSRNVFELRGNVINSNYGTDAGLPTIDGRVPASLADTVLLNTPYDYLRYRSADVTGSYVGVLGDGLTLQARLQVQRLRQDYFSTEVVGFQMDDPGRIARSFFRFDHNMTIGLGQAELRWRGTLGVPHTAILGYDGSMVDFRSPRGFADASSVDALSPQETQGAPSVPFSRTAHRNQTLHSLHLADMMSLSDLRIVAGGRLDLYDVTRRSDLLDPGTGEVSERGMDVNQFTAAPSANFGLVYVPNANVAPYVSLTTSVRPQAPTSLPDGFEQLQAERARQFEAGVHLTLGPSFGVQAAAYQIDKSNILVQRPNMEVDQAGAARSRGAEIGAQVTSDRLSVTAGYALTLAKFVDYIEDGNDFSGKRLPDVAAHTLTTWFSYALPRGVTLGMGGRFVDRAFADRANAVIMPAYLIADASASWRRGLWTMSLASRNLLDRNPLAADGRYFVSTIYDTQLTPGAPRTVLLSIEYSN